ncbi:hypothetical protein L7F22_011956 [Adiantum nelumboides]|nr:hypothetical protein [Adiantum nelumboides]
MDDEEQQSEELIRAVTAQDDFELAYRLQVQEAMAASSSDGQNLVQQADAQDKATTCSYSPDDRALALMFQNEELYRSQIEEQDRILITHDIEQLQFEIKRRTHDAAFAKSLMDMDDGEWEAHGNLQQSPFDTSFTPAPSGTSSDFVPFCKLYTTVASSENKTDDNNVLFAMGAVIFDAQSVVLTELKKSFEPGTKKAMADYMALLAGLQTVHGMGFQCIEAHTDSILLYNQVCAHFLI